MKKLYLLLFVIVFASCGTQTSKQPAGNGTTSAAEENWVSLFNGKDLEGWDIKITGSDLNVNYKNTFRVEDGVLKVRYDEYEKFNNEFGHIFYNKPFSHYKLRIEYRFVGDQVPGGPSWAFRNSGVMLHSQSAATMNKDQDFPVSIEAQFLGGDGKSERTTSNVCTPGTNIVMNGELITAHCNNSKSKTYHGDQWVTAEFVVLGDSIIHHILEGDTVLTYTKPQVGGGNGPKDYPLPEGTLISSGYICLQAESHPVEFRKVEILELSKK